MWSKPLLWHFRQSGKILQTQVLQGFAAFRLALFRIPPRHSQTKRATICATPRCSVLKASVSHKTYYTPEGEKMSSVGACKKALANPAQRKSRCWKNWCEKGTLCIIAGSSFSSIVTTVSVECNGRDCCSFITEQQTGYSTIGTAVKEPSAVV